MVKRDKFVGARIPKATDYAIKTLLKKEEYRHRTYSDIINMALEKFINASDKKPKKTK